MARSDRPRILVVDDEEAILETMTFTFENEYEVLTASDAARAMDLLDVQAPVAVVLTDQRMPGTTGVEFLAEVYRRHPATVRIILTGFADMEAIIEAINSGHVYAYITKPWEQEEIRQVVKRAVDHHLLQLENQRLLQDLSHTKTLLEAVMDQLDTGALGVDGEGVIRAANQPARRFLSLPDDPRGRSLRDLLAEPGLEPLARATELLEEGERRFAEVDLERGRHPVRLRVMSHPLVGPDGGDLGRVLLLREISHEPLRRRLDGLVAELAEAERPFRERAERAQAELRALLDDARATGIASAGIEQVRELASRCQTALQSWLDVDDALVAEEFPDAQLLRERMRLGLDRWPSPEKLPEPVRELADRVEVYYETGENPRIHVL